MLPEHIRRDNSKEPNEIRLGAVIDELKDG